MILSRKYPRDRRNCIFSDELNLEHHANYTRLICITDDDDENYIDKYAMMITMTVMLLIMIMAKTRMIMKMPLICIRFCGGLTHKYAQFT